MDYLRHMYRNVLLSWSLKLLLKIPGAFDLIKNYMKDLSDEKTIVNNVIQGKLWQEKYAIRDLAEDEYLMPFFLYEDDFDIGNCIGSHAGSQKFGGVYASLPGFPPELSSQLRFILLTLLYKSQHRKDYGNKAIFGPLIAEINSLNREGLVITCDKKQYKVYFQLLLISGDNLGSNEIFGFQDTFNSGKPCRK